MLEPPNLEEGVIRAALEAHYGISGARLAFLPVGNDSETWVYRVQSSRGQIYFLKLRAGDGFRAPSLLVPHALQELGVPHMVAPLATGDRALWVDIGDFVLALYPFIDGRVGAEAGLSAAQWRAFGALVKRIHACRLAPEILERVPRERFVPSRRHLIEELENAAGKEAFGNAEERDFAALWQVQEDVIGRLVARADALGERLRQTASGRVLCHADMHTWNVLLDGDGDFWLVDWDEVVMALKERDLMFVVGGIGGDGVGAEETEWFLQGYGHEAIDAEALTYYRYAWAVQDIAAYGEQVFFAPDAGSVSRRAAVQGFRGMFAPGSIVERALGTSPR